MIDLHIHTSKSDGEFSPTQIVHMAEKRDIETIAITDHDTCAGAEEAIKEGEKIGVRVISGIEITAFEEEEIHILGYNVDYNSELLKKYKKDLEHKLENEEEITFDTFRKLGFNIKKKDIEKYANGNSIAPGHFIDWLIENRYEKDRRQAYNKYFVKGELKNRKSDRMNIVQAIDFIISLDGIPVFAHPCRTSYSDEKLEEKIKRLKEEGLEGIEAVYSMATDTQIEFYTKLAQKYNLLITMGSDYHGPRVKDYIEMGTGEEKNLVKYQEKSEKYTAFQDKIFI